MQESVLTALIKISENFEDDTQRVFRNQETDVKPSLTTIWLNRS